MSTPMFHFQSTLGEGPYATVIRGFSGFNPYGSIWFVSASGSDANVGNSVSKAFATLAAAISAAAAGDTIVVGPGLTVTLTAVLAISKAGLQIIGIGTRTRKPIISLTGAVDALSLEAAGIVLDNFHFAAPSTDEATAMINVAAAGCVLRNITGIGSQTAKNFVDCITVAAGADDLTIENCQLWNSVVAVNSFLSIEAVVARLTLLNVFFFGDVATAGIIDAATATQLNWDGVVVGVVGTAKPAATLDSNPTGLIRRARFSGTHTTLATNANLGNAIRLFDVLVLEETDGSKQGALIPAVDTD